MHPFKSTDSFDVPLFMYIYFERILMVRIPKILLLIGDETNRSLDCLTRLFQNAGYRVVRYHFPSTDGEDSAARASLLRRGLKGMGGLRNIFNIAGPFDFVVNCLEMPDDPRNGNSDTLKLYFDTVIRFGRIVQMMAPSMIARSGGKFITLCTEPYEFERVSEIQDGFIAAMAGSVLFASNLLQREGLDFYGVLPLRENSNNMNRLSTLLLMLLSDELELSRHEVILDEYGVPHELANRIAHLSLDVSIFNTILDELKTQRLNFEGFPAIHQTLAVENYRKEL